MVGVIFSLLIMVVGAVIWCCIHLIFCFDITNSLLVSVLIQILTREEPWSSTIRWCMFLGIMMICLALQNASKIMRVLFGAFSSFVIGVFGYAWVEYGSKQEQWMVTVICMLVGVFLNYLCWARKKGEEMEACA